MEKLTGARDAFEKGLELDKDNTNYVKCTKQVKLQKHLNLCDGSIDKETKKCTSTLK